MHKSGQVIAPVIYDDILNYRNFWATAFIDGETVYIDTSGTEIRLQQPNFHDFNKGPKRMVKNGVTKYVNENNDVVLDGG